MAIKAMFEIQGFQPEAGLEYRAVLHIWDATHNVTSLVNAEYFQATASSAAVNSSLKSFVEDYIQSEWGVSYNQVTDSVKLLNPVSLL